MGRDRQRQAKWAQRKIKFFYLFMILFVGLGICSLIISTAHISGVHYSKVWRPHPDTLQVYLPMAFTIVLVFVIIRPRLRLFVVPGREIRFSLYLSALAFGSWLLLCSIQYAIDDMFKYPIRLNSITQVSAHPLTGYYSIAKLYPYSSHGGQATYQNDFDSNDDIGLRVQLCCPLLSSPKDTDSWRVNSYWAAKTYDTTISKSLPYNEMNYLREEFYRRSVHSFMYIDFTDTADFMVKEDGELNDLYSKALRSSLAFKSAKRPIIFEASYIDTQLSGANHEQALSGFSGWLGVSIAIGFFAAFAAALMALPAMYMKTSAEYRYFLPYWVKYSRKARRPLNIPLNSHDKHPYTWGLIYVNCAYFLLITLLLGNDGLHNDWLVKFGALYTPYLLHGQIWRLLSYGFIHMYAGHLIANMIALAIIGIPLEERLGGPRFLAYYLCFIIASALLSAAVHRSLVCGGASGGIFGLYALFGVFTFTKILKPKRSSFFITCTLLYFGWGFFSAFTNPNIDNAGHVGGLLAGIIVGLIFRAMWLARHEYEEAELEQEVIVQENVSHPDE